MVILETNLGDIALTLFEDKAAITTKNFLDYVQQGFYDETIFHRVIGGFVIQGGGLTEDMEQKPPHESIKNEADNGLKNGKYTVAMARTNAPHSANSQFFINMVDNTFLDHPGQDGWGYCVFGEVVSGKEVVDRIGQVKTTSKLGHSDVPIEAITIKKARIKK